LLYVGEVRDTETAVEVLKAAANGMLVITTVHSFDPPSALLRLSSLAEHDMGAAANITLSQALRLVVHQRLSLDPAIVGWKRGKFTGTALVSDGPSHAVANHIRKGEFSQLPNVMLAQQVKIQQACKAPLPVPELLL